MSGELRALYVLGGRQKDVAHGLPEWHRHERALIVRVDLDTGRSEVCVDYQSPPEVCPDQDPAILFKAGTVERDRLYVCTQTEVIVYSLPDFQRVHYVSLPLFNDLHHVRPSRNGGMLVVSTGLDLVLEVDQNGEVLREWGVAGEDTWQRFSRDEDYRKVPTTKPHRSHPNHVFYLRDHVWVTRFEQRDAVCLSGELPAIKIGVQRPHDGHVVDGRVYFTTVDGHVVVASADTLEVEAVHDLNAISRARRPLGWCRGLHVCDGERVVVGFSRLRPTRIRANVTWVKGAWKNLRSVAKAPSRIAMYDLARRRLLWERELEETGLSVLFSVLPALL